METTNVQQVLVDCIAGLLRDPGEAIDYARNPKAYLEDRMGDVDMGQVDMPAAMEQAATQAQVAPEMADAIQTSIYQPAPMIRVPAPTEAPLNDAMGSVPDGATTVGTGGDQYDEKGGDPYNEKGGDQYNEKGGDQYDGMKDRPQERMDDDPARMDEPMRTEKPAERFEGDNAGEMMTPDYVEAPAGEMPGMYEQIDGGGFHVAPPVDMGDTYSAEKFTPDTMNLDCVEYSVSNCVTTCYQDSPEIAEQLCHTRSYADPYTRVDPAHECNDIVIEQHPDYLVKPDMDDRNQMDDGNDKPGNDYVDEKPVDEYGKPVDDYDNGKPHDYVDEKPVDEYDKPVENYDKPVENYDKPVENYDKPVDEYGKPVENYDNGKPVDEYDNGKPHDYVDEKPVDEYGKPVENYDKPVDEYGKPVENYDNGKPVDEYDNGKPHDYVDEKPVDEYGKPVENYDNGKPHDEYDNGKPHDYVDEKPVDEYGKPVENYDNGKPVENYDNGKPVDEYVNEKPVDDYGSGEHPQQTPPAAYDGQTPDPYPAEQNHLEKPADDYGNGHDKPEPMQEHVEKAHNEVEPMEEPTENPMDYQQPDYVEEPVQEYVNEPMHADPEPMEADIAEPMDDDMMADG